MRKAIREGVVLLERDLPEGRDISNTAQSELISHIQSELMKTFKRPQLKRGCEFYSEFSAAYEEAIRVEEFRIWENMSNEIDNALSKNPDRELSEKEAAYLAYTMHGSEDPPQSWELYMNLAVFARVYEELLRKKYDKQFSSKLFYEALRTHMPTFLFHLMSMSPIILRQVIMYAKPRELLEESPLLHPRTTLESRCFEIGKDDSFSFLPKFVEAMCDHVWEHKHEFREDPFGRTEDRGCPFLYSSRRNEVMRFSIEELIAQHKQYE